MTHWNARILLSAAVVLAACSHPPPPPLADNPEWTEAHAKAAFRDSGTNLGRARAEDVARHLEEVPDDLVSHQKLLLFFTVNGTRFYDPAVVLVSRRKHVLWLIEHHPEDPLLSEPTGALNAKEDPAGFAQAKKLWQTKGAAFQAKADIWLKLADPPPLDPISIPAHEAAVARHRAELADKIDAGEHSLAISASLLEQACIASDWDNSRTLAADIIHAVPTSTNDPDYGTAVFRAHIVSGILAMRTGDRQAALDHMQQAANAPATEDLQYAPQPCAYRLLSWLLKDGERESVIGFLRRFAQTSVVDRDQLTHSIDLIRRNLKPVWYPQ